MNNEAATLLNTIKMISLREETKFYSKSHKNDMVLYMRVISGNRDPLRQRVALAIVVKCSYDIRLQKAGHPHRTRTYEKVSQQAVTNTHRRERYKLDTVGQNAEYLRLTL
jgi:hypothetical protein